MEGYVTYIETEVDNSHIAQWLRICMVPEAAGSTHWLLLLQLLQLPHLLMQQLEFELQKTIFCIPFMHYLWCIYAYIQVLVL